MAGITISGGASSLPSGWRAIRPSGQAVTNAVPIHRSSFNPNAQTVQGTYTLNDVMLRPWLCYQDMTVDAAQFVKAVSDFTGTYGFDFAIYAHSEATGWGTGTPLAISSSPLSMNSGTSNKLTTGEWRTFTGGAVTLKAGTIYWIAYRVAGLGTAGTTGGTINGLPASSNDYAISVVDNANFSANVWGYYLWPGQTSFTGLSFPTHVQTGNAVTTISNWPCFFLRQTG